jgi:thiol:disulfide interchange protein DsbD
MMLCMVVLVVAADAGAAAAVAAETQPVAATQPAPLVTARLMCDRAALVMRTDLRLGVLLTIKPGWHVYWRNPGDGGLSTSVRWQLPDGITAGELLWPVPQRFVDPSGQVTTYGYEGQVLLWSRVKVARSVALGQGVTLAAKVSWLVCNKDRCVPGTADLTCVLPVAVKAKLENAELFGTWEATLPVDAAGPDSPVEVSTGGEVAAETGVGILRVTVRWKKPRGAGVVQVFPVAGPELEVSDIKALAPPEPPPPPPEPPAADTDGWTMQVRVLQGQGPAPEALPVVLGYQDAAGVRRGVTVCVPLEIKKR